MDLEQAVELNPVENGEGLGLALEGEILGHGEITARRVVTIPSVSAPRFRLVD